MKNNKIIVLSLGGSIIIPKQGFDINFLSDFKKIILKLINNGYRFIIVCGGGQTARLYQKAAEKLSKLTRNDIDWTGIYATWLNGCLVKNIFKEAAHPAVIKNPLKKIVWKAPILIAGGWKPGFSTDYDAVKLARLYGAEKVINLSNVDYVYDKDPRKFSGAKKIKKMSWDDFRTIVGNTWIPGANLPFDPVASREAQKIGLTLHFVKGTNLREAEKAIIGRNFEGTIVCEKENKKTKSK